jgi:SpoVK/Ycf46/Vps4 family AAA+-type ATPase
MTTDFEFDLDSSDTPSTPAAPLIRIWILRMLVLFGKYKKLIDRHGQTTDDFDMLAHAIGIGHWGGSDKRLTPRKALSELKRLLKQDAALPANHLAPSPLEQNAEQVASLLGLTDVERRLLEFGVLLHSESALENSAELLSTFGAWQVSPVLSMLLDLPEPEVRAALSNQAILARSGLITLERGDRFALCNLLDVMPGVGGRMLSQEADTPNLFRDAFAPAQAAELALTDYDHIQPDLVILLPYLKHALANAQPGVNIYLHGLPGTGKSQLTRTLARELQAELFNVSTENDEGNPIDGEKRLRALRAAQYVLKASRALLVFDEAEDVFDDGFSFFGMKSTSQKRKGWINQMLESNSTPCLWLSNSIDGMDPAFMRRFDMVLEMPVPPRSQRERIIADTCGDLVNAPAIAQLARRDELTPAVIARAAKVVRAIREETPDQPAAIERLVSGTLVAQGHAPLRLADGPALPSFYHPDYINADANLTALATGIARAGSARLCLFGPPGTGKTAYGRWLAERLNKPLRTRRVSDLVSPYVGMTEKNLARAFREAETEQAVFLLDEVDSFLQDRRQARHGWEVTTVNEMLTQMEAFPGLFIASTNLMDGLDPAALRRFDLKVRFDFLRPEQALALLRHHAEALGLSITKPGDETRLRKLAALTPGDFATVARQARFQPFADITGLLDALEAECAAKEEGRHLAIGFMS